eukprot:12879736-Heterocapsa_arctica.AAC.1
MNSKRESAFAYSTSRRSVWFGKSVPPPSTPPYCDGGRRAAMIGVRSFLMRSGRILPMWSETRSPL